MQPAARGQQTLLCLHNSKTPLQHRKWMLDNVLIAQGASLGTKSTFSLITACCAIGISPAAQAHLP